MLFDDFERTIKRPAKHRENWYTYINHSAHAGAKLVRENLEEWFSKYPDEHKESFKKDFMGSDYLSFFSELLMHQILVELGATDKIIHPKISGTNKKPDFKVVLGNQEVVLEVKTIREDQNVIINQFQDELNQRYFTTGYVLGLAFEGDFEKSISVNRFIKFLEDIKNKEDFSALRESQISSGQTPVWEFFSDDKSVIQIEFFFLNDATREYKVPIGVTSAFEAIHICPSNIVLQSLKKKASRYGELNMPYIIVLNYEEGYVDSSSIADALFGDLQEVSYYGSRESRFERANNGLWGGKKNTRVSGVLSLNGAGPWGFQEKRPVMWLNPWAKYPFNSACLKDRITLFEVDEITGHMKTSEGGDFSDILKYDID